MPFLLRILLMWPETWRPFWRYVCWRHPIDVKASVCQWNTYRSRLLIVSYRLLSLIIQEAPYKAFRFETPAVSPNTVSSTQFEFVLVDDMNLFYFAATPRPVYFEEHLSSPSCKNEEHDLPAGCVFTNLGGDATLVAPLDWSPPSSEIYSRCYGHVANFFRGAPEQQVLEIWKMLGNILRDELLTPSKAGASDIPLWFSTAGTGVPYLHFRLDSRPKYYHYDPFKNFHRLWKSPTRLRSGRMTTRGPFLKIL